VFSAHLYLDSLNVPSVGGGNGEKPFYDKPMRGIQLENISKKGALKG
jgi:hypothetical protein